MTYNVAQWVRGSSPLTRGKPYLSVLDDRVPGLIPAHAGKTWAYPSATFPPRAHPRSRGENGPAAGMVPRVVGSSPLTRGKQTNAALAGPPGRLIPAHAGKTTTRIRTWFRQWAHPRSRGENAGGRARGRRGGRLIPAHAGKTCQSAGGGAAWRAHPRSRGENIYVDWATLHEAGSSPLTRGKRSRAASSPPAAGLIPAHAGKTMRRASRTARWWAHPRSRGENVRIRTAIS